MRRIAALLVFFCLPARGENISRPIAAPVPLSPTVAPRLDTPALNGSVGLQPLPALGEAPIISLPPSAMETAALDAALTGDDGERVLVRALQKAAHGIVGNDILLTSFHSVEQLLRRTEQLHQSLPRHSRIDDLFGRILRDMLGNEGLAPKRPRQALRNSPVDEAELRLVLAGLEPGLRDMGVAPLNLDNAVFLRGGSDSTSLYPESNIMRAGAFHFQGKYYVFRRLLRGLSIIPAPQRTPTLAAVLLHEHLASQTKEHHREVARRVEDLTGIRDEDLHQLVGASLRPQGMGQEAFTSRLAMLNELIGRLEAGSVPRIGAVTDVHGDWATFRLWNESADDERTDKKVIGGDFMDKGLHPIAVADRIRREVDAGKAVALLGNHELLFIRAMLGGPKEGSRWLNMGGNSALLELSGRHPGLNQDNFRRNPELVSLLRWMLKNIRLYDKDAHGVLHIHAGIPVSEKGLPDLAYGDQDGLAALDLMTEELRQVLDLYDASPDDPNLAEASILRRLDKNNSIIHIKYWMETLAEMAQSEEDLKRRVDLFLAALGVLKIVTGHATYDGDLSQVDERLFNMDLHARENSVRMGGMMSAGPNGLRFYVTVRHPEGLHRKTVYSLTGAQYLDQLRRERARMASP